MLTELSFISSHKWQKIAFLIINFVLSAQLLLAQKPTNISSKGSTFKAKLINLEEPTNEPFRFNTTLQNSSNKALVYDLEAKLSPGWTITYTVNGSQVTSINMESGKSQDISIEIGASPNASPKKYIIPVKAISGTDTLSLSLEAVVKGSYSLSLSTPTGKLNEELTSGSTKQIQLVVSNLGTLPFTAIDFTSQLPTGWECSFEPSRLDKLAPGKSITINANLKVPDKTIAGDYAATFTATNSNSNAKTDFRLEIKTSLLTGWAGVLVILLAIGIVYYLIRKYGRR
ncbi:hypothetical protein I5M32_09760 [Pedobacter sp. SD-b]|uniref:Alpha-galactosidase NEW3 domain-containing protein n=1 Tax=Pedobacter segetis TaxID=2793069 RepID=A0ABS1BM21_9SPHI|nr:NEW3 domain-containing protein [Pedobacter segetis]MBK0383244.1 hypothetical protein [Pedobacter segetis]